MTRSSTVRRVAVGSAVAAGATALASAAGSLAAAGYFARKVLTPDHRRPDDHVIFEIDEESVVVDLTPESVVPGRFGMWFAGGDGHLRVGDVLGIDELDRRVRRRLVAVDRGIPAPGPARWDTYYWWAPPDDTLGLPTRYVGIQGELGTLPAWVVPGPGDGRRWAVLVHGRGARREETIRAIPALHGAGLTVLAASYRNDPGVESGPDGRYNLGLSEWRDVESAVRFALSRGAREVVVGGWSMGGAIVLQFLDRSALAGAVSRVFLDAPVLDWGNVLEYHSRLNHIPVPVAALAQMMMGRAWGKRIVGVHDVLDVASTDWVARAGDVRHRLLVVHSVDDEFVPVGPSRALAERRPDLVTFAEFHLARHCQEWNVEPQRWEETVREFVTG